MNNRAFPYPRGKILGGSTSVSEWRAASLQFGKGSIDVYLSDYLFHQFGSDDDWNRLASVSGDQGWSWNNIKKYVQKVRIYTLFINYMGA